MVQFRPAAEKGRFDPPVVEDFSAAMAADDQRKIQTFDQLLAQQNDIAKQEVEEAKKTPTNLQQLDALSKFSQTASKAVQDYAKRTKQDIEDGIAWDEFTGGNFNPNQDVAEDVATEAADIQQEGLKKVTNEIELNFGKIAGNQYFNNNAGIGRGLRNEVSLLTAAKSNYAPFLMAFKQSDRLINFNGVQIPASQAFRSSDYGMVKAAHQAARYEFIKQNGLQYATKKNFNKIFKDTAVATEASSASNILNENITKERGDIIAAQTANLTNGILTNPGDMTQLYQDTAQNLYQLNTGLSRSEANSKAIDAIINAANIKGPGEGQKILNDLLAEQQRPGIAGTEIGLTNNAVKIRQAIRKLDEAGEAEDRRAGKDLLLQSYRMPVEGRPTNEIVGNLYGLRDQALALGQRDVADALERKIRAYEGGRDIKLTSQEIVNDVLAGVPYSKQDLLRLLADKKLTNDGYRTALRAIEDIKLSPTANSILKTKTNQFAGSLAISAGLRADTTGDVPLIKGASGSRISGITKSNMQALVDNYNIRLRTLITDIESSLPVNMSRAEKDKVINREVNEWYQANVVSPNGALNYDGLQYINWSNTTELSSPKFQTDNQGNITATAEQQAKAKQDLAKLQITAPAQILNLRQATAVDVTEAKQWGELESWTPGSPITPTMKTDFSLRRGDTLFDYDTTVEYVKDFQKNGFVSKELQAAADGLAKSPRAFLRAHALHFSDRLKEDGIDTDIFETSQVPQQRSSSGQMTPMQGAQYLMTRYDLPARGAAYLSGNIQTESSWDPSQKPWDDVGAPAGTLMSLRASRLEAIQKEYGIPVQYLTTEQQLDYMMKEMEEDYPEAYAIFTDPQATKRELMDASYIYWVYGIEGDRFKTAEQLRQQLNQ